MLRPGNVAIANKVIVERVIQPMILGENPLNRMCSGTRSITSCGSWTERNANQALSGVDIALWDILGKVTGLSISRLIGGRFREQVPVYGYGMMLRREKLPALMDRFEDEAAAIKSSALSRPR